MARRAFAHRGILLVALSRLSPPAAGVTGRGRMVEDLLEGEPPPAAVPSARTAGGGPVTHLESGNVSSESSRRASGPAPTVLTLGAHGSLQQLSGGSRKGRSKDDSKISLYHWSPHWQCFAHNKNDCANKAREQVKQDLEDNNVDFGNVIELVGFEPPEGYGMSKGHCERDDVVFLYKEANWEPGEERPGCMDVKDGQTDRAFLVQTFKSKESGEELVFAGAHFPHVQNQGDQRMNSLKEKIEAATSGDTKKVIFVADTNLEIESRDIAEQLGIPDMDSLVVSDKLPTCCWERGRMGQLPYDRIIANFGSALEGLKRLHADPVPDWAGDEMHAGITAVLEA